MGVYEKIDRVTVAEAAARLGVKEQAIRKRVQRGTIAHDKDVDGRVHVFLAPEYGATGTGAGVDTGMSTLVQSLQDQIAYLRQEAEDWKEEARRKDAIIMSLTQRFPELETPAEPHAAFDTAGEGTGKGSTTPLESQEPSQRRSWPHRFFRAMKGMAGVRRVLCLVTVCVLAVLMVASVGSAQGLYDKDLPPPPATDPELPPGVGEPPRGGRRRESRQGMIRSCWKLAGTCPRLRSQPRHPRPTTADASPYGGWLG